MQVLPGLHFKVKNIHCMRIILINGPIFYECVEFFFGMKNETFA